MVFDSSVLAIKDPMTTDENHVRHIVILIHGIRTFGEWQHRLSKMLHEVEPSIEVQSISTDTSAHSLFSFHFSEPG